MNLFSLDVSFKIFFKYALFIFCLMYNLLPFKQKSF